MTTMLYRQGTMAQLYRSRHSSYSLQLLISEVISRLREVLKTKNQIYSVPSMFAKLALRNFRKERRAALTIESSFHIEIMQSQESYPQQKLASS
jgi:hypothetical protein